MAGSLWQCDVSLRLGHLLETHDPACGFGTMSASVYDTAWVACVHKSADGSTQWLFPAAYKFVLQTQLREGGWLAHADEQRASPDQADVLTTLAALYCLLQHQSNPHQPAPGTDDDLAGRIARASSHLSQLLARWDPRATKAVGNEVLVPALLDLLREAGHDFHFEGKPALMQLRDQKLSRITPQILYAHAPSSLLHSLEAFHGRADVDFDKFSHHKIGGSMMCSPSATASYLIRRSTWDDEAEHYLRLVVSHGAGKSSGAVPSAFPSTYFELTWVASLLLENNLWVDSTATRQPKEILCQLLEQGAATGGGVLGFAPGVQADLDDSSKASTILSLLGRRGLAQSIVSRFDGPSHLRTYFNERDPSISANCNALIAMLLDRSQFHGKVDAIEKVVRFVCNTWFDSNGDMKDKWNVSPYYSIMYMTKSLNQLLHSWDDGDLSDLPLKLIVSYALPVMMQCAVMLLQRQEVDGSWGESGPIEETSYAVLALLYIQPLPLISFLGKEIAAAVEKGRNFLSTQQITSPEYIWVEKVTYGSMHLSDAYRYAACHSSISSVSFSAKTVQLFSGHHESTTTFAASINPGLLQLAPRWLILASWIESLLLLPLVQATLPLNLSSADEFGEGSKRSAANFKVLLSKNVSDMHMPARAALRISAAALVADAFFTARREHEQDGALLFTCKCRKRLAGLGALRFSNVTQGLKVELDAGLDTCAKPDHYVYDHQPSPSATSISSRDTAATSADLIFSDAELDHELGAELPAPACKIPSAIPCPNATCVRMIETANTLTAFFCPAGSSVCPDDSLTSELSRFIVDASTPHCREAGESDHFSLLTLYTLLLLADGHDVPSHRRHLSEHISRNLRTVLARLFHLQTQAEDMTSESCVRAMDMLTEYERRSLSLGLETLRDVGCTRSAQAFNFLSALLPLYEFGAFAEAI